MRSIIKRANASGIHAVVDQQFEGGADSRSWPRAVVEPEVIKVSLFRQRNLEHHQLICWQAVETFDEGRLSKASARSLSGQ